MSMFVVLCNHLHAKLRTLQSDQQTLSLMPQNVKVRTAPRSLLLCMQEFSQHIYHSTSTACTVRQARPLLKKRFQALCAGACICRSKLGASVKVLALTVSKCTATAVVTVTGRETCVLLAWVGVAQCCRFLSGCFPPQDNALLLRQVEQQQQLLLPECTKDDHTFLGFVSCCMDCFKLVRGPSTRHWFSLKWFSRTFQRGCLLSTLGLPRMTSPYLARVSATFSLLGSLRNPMPCMRERRWCSSLSAALDMMTCPYWSKSEKHLDLLGPLAFHVLTGEVNVVHNRRWYIPTACYSRQPMQ